MKIFLASLFVFAASLVDARRIEVGQICVQYGENLGDRVKHQLDHLLQPFRSMDHSSETCSANEIANTVILSIGNTSIWLESLQSQLDSLPDESFIIKSWKSSANTLTVACNGSPLASHTHKNVSFDTQKVHYGAIVAGYACLELLGFGFFHPLEPYTPPSLTIHETICNKANLTDLTDCNITIVESPHWPERSFHIHTQHPLELTEVLQGNDIPQFGPHGSHCGPDGGSPAEYCERWEDMVQDVNQLFQWAVANRLNKVEWLLLGNYKWGDELSSKFRRLQILTNLGHDYSLLIGADCPLGNIQQHGWHIVSTRLPFRAQQDQIRERVDWVFNAGFDFFTTESGLSEFTHPDCDLMVELINTFAEYVNKTWGREAGIKVHCSTGQYCDNYLDPENESPTNFNFLPSFATTDMGVFPHTVQVYAFDDPTAGAYGNENFGYMEEYLVKEAKKGHRSVVYYGETAYWVSVDIDVPLFLPLYGQRRLHDLRRLAGREIREEFRMQGQMNFDSGWEWGYWINDVIVARASWNPRLSENVTNEDLRRRDEENWNSNLQGYSESDDQWESYGDALRDITRIFPANIDDRVNKLIIRLAQEQARLLINGEVNGKPCPNLKKLSGMPYLSGCDTWVDLPRMFGLPLLQPNKIHFRESYDDDWGNMMDLLAAMETTFVELADEMSSIVHEANSCDDKPGVGGSYACDSIDWAAMDILLELQDSVSLLAKRATHVHMLYKSRDHVHSPTGAHKAHWQQESRRIIHEAERIVRSREEHGYRVPWRRVASWRENPTVYRYGYLWSVHSLYYWWRDQGLAEEGSLQSELSPCYLNRMDASEVAVGWGKYSWEFIRTLINRYSPFTTGFPLELVNCFAPPTHEYVFPKDLYPIQE